MSEEQEKTPEKGKKRERELVTASIKSFSRPKYSDCADEADYKRRLEARNVLVMREKERILSTITAPRDERDDKLLRWECEVKGIASEGIRAILLQRLAGHDQGRNVLMADHMNQTKAARIDAGEARQESLTQKKQVIRQLGNGKGEDTFLALPHDMLQNALLPFVNLFSLVCLARTCKYLTRDATQELWKRARAMFGEKGGTPKAIGALMAMCTNYKSVLLVKDMDQRYYVETWWHSKTEYEMRDTMKVWCGKLNVRYDHQFGTTRAYFLHQRMEAELPFLNRSLISGHDYEALTVARCIKKHGTVESALKTAQLRAEKADLLVEERKTLAQSEEARVKALNDYIGFNLFSPGTEIGRERAAKYTHLAGAGRTPLLNLTPLGELLYAISGSHVVVNAHKKCTNHVYKGEPKTVAGGASDMKSFINPLLGALSAVLSVVNDLPRGKGALDAHSIPKYAWVFTHLLGACANVIKDLHGADRPILESLCDIARRPDTSGLDRMRNPENYLGAMQQGSTAFMSHCVILIVHTEEYKRVRILYLNQRVKSSEEQTYDRVYTISLHNVLDALPLEDDDEMKQALRTGHNFYRNPCGPSVSTQDWQLSALRPEIYMPVNRATETHGRATSFGGVYYRPQWLPFAPMSVIIQ